MAAEVQQTHTYLVLVSLSLAGTMKKKGENSWGLNTNPIIPKITILDSS